MTGFSAVERAYLKSRHLGRMATVDPEGQPQANPVGFFLQDDDTVLIGGFAMGKSKKWRNLQSNPRISLVVDDIVSVRPWKVRGVEIRGVAELLVGPHELGAHFSEEVIRIVPEWIYSWRLEDERKASRQRWRKGVAVQRRHSGTRLTHEQSRA
ncbi:PPOX class F420-dependent oxidoreductase [Streptomyces sp. TRM66268-LWL]|uniref:PPOX class F420-dependent oxidoreductase n=1 Tax=Streptomyces polyasparticus TaxID=2767826 RepID=A0ABR7SBY7_9ACTN|nr:PPOX class F420-dependent oxidoreductase [Streptomyces polyasparticus]